jgi:diguanylate cyclase (GGDEF)-like protein
MFRVADKARVVAWFDLACMEECLKNAAEMQIRHLLFVNMDAEGLSAMGMQERPMAVLAREHGLAPENIVIEITERQMVGDFPRLIEDIKQLREKGFRIAIDDAGAGYSSLRAVAELRPDFVKIDRDLVKNIDLAGERRALLAALSQYARNVGASVIAEGAESREELAVLIDLGIPYAQGYVLGKPADTLRGTPRDTREYIQQRVEVREMQRSGGDVTAGRLSRPGLVMDSATPLSEAVRRFSKEPSLTSIAVVEEEQVRGLLLRQQLDHVLPLVKAARAAEMMPAETISQWMRTDIHRVTADTPVCEVIEQVIARQNVALDADVLVLDYSGAYKGVVSVRSLMEAAVNQPVRQARYADPLTGLPGRVQLEHELRARLDSQAPLGVIRLDISHLADLNDQYGLSYGDDLILALAGLIKEVSLQCGTASDLTAHLGGDNFLLLTGAQETPGLCRALTEGFNEIARVSVPTAHGVASQARLPLCTISVAALTNRNRRLQSLQQITNGLQELMRQVKSQPGSHFAIDVAPGCN